MYIQHFSCCFFFFQFESLTSDDMIEFFTKMTFLPYLLVAQFAWEFINIHYWTSRFILAECLALTILEATRVRWLISGGWRLVPVFRCHTWIGKKLSLWTYVLRDCNYRLYYWNKNLHCLLKFLPFFFGREGVEFQEKYHLEFFNLWDKCWNCSLNKVSLTELYL